jgi:N-methylhydantoinase B/oxoprolinase/acetone carboxylase alpha subunit
MTLAASCSTIADTVWRTTRSMPVFNQTLPHVAQYFIDKCGEDGIRPSDIYITNDPWLCAGHQPDIAVILPFFRDGKRVGFAGSIGHMADWRALDSNAVLRCMRKVCSFRRHAMQKTNLWMQCSTLCVRMLRVRYGHRRHSRASERAQVGAAKALALLDEYNLDGLDGIADEIHERSEAAMRDAIRAVPDGTYRCALTFDELDGPLPLQVAVTIQGDEITVDYTGSAPQHPRGGINCTLTYTLAHSAYSLKCALLPEVPSNAGCYTPILVIAPDGRVLNCKPPASVMNRARTGWYIAPLIFGALSQVIPDRVMASGGLMTGFKVRRRHRRLVVQRVAVQLWRAGWKRPRRWSVNDNFPEQCIQRAYRIIRDCRASSSA